MTTIIGCDPGLNGGIAVITADNKVYGQIMPKIGKEFDLHQLHKILKDYKAVFKAENIHVFIEDVHALFGVAAGTTFTFGGIFLATQAICVCLDLRYTLVQPKAWQKEVWQGIPEQRKPSTTQIVKGKEVVKRGAIDTKAMSLLAKKRLFPSVSCLPTARCSKEHDGLVDALLLAEFGKRKLNIKGSK